MICDRYVQNCCIKVQYQIGFIAPYALSFSNRMENINIYFLIFIVWLISLVESYSYFLAMRPGSEG
jgi:hypothetical protein